MFAGIVETLGVVEATRPRAAATRLCVQTPRGWLDGVPCGASIAVNGCCLTLVEVRDGAAAFDVIPETLRGTSLGGLRAGDRVHLERSLRVGDRIDGHFVQGHVDAVGRVERVERTEGEWKLWVRVPAETSRFIVRKGAIAVDGVSLTVVDAQPGLFSVALIPTTLERTVLSSRGAGAAVNVETDMLARQVVARVDALLADAASGGLTEARLHDAGFLP